MALCECGRALQEGEKICPACKAEKDSKTKTIIEVVVGGIALIVAAITGISRKGGNES